jgi:hypothetical protein
MLQKFLAQFFRHAEARLAMTLGPRPQKRARAFTAVFVSAAFLWTLTVSVSPQLHERIHRDADRIAHTCAVTFVASGSYDHAAHGPLISAPAPAVPFSKVPALTPQWVESPFSLARIFEHAPPTCA